MISLPESIQELVGRKIARIFTSHPANDQIVFDLETSSTNTTTRYAYDITGQVSRIWNHGEMVGYTVSEVRALDNEPDGTNKMAIFTDDGARFGVIYFAPTSDCEGPAWVPIDDTNLNYALTEAAEGVSISDSIVHYDHSGSAYFSLTLYSGDETPLRVTTQEWSATDFGETAEFRWDEDEEQQSNSAADPDNDFEPSPLVMFFSVGTPIVYEFFTESSISASFLVEVYVDCSSLLNPYSDVVLTDVTLGRNPPFNSSVQYIVQEDDVSFTFNPE